jgi:hypothetical protein
MLEFVRRVPQDDNRERMICADCGHISYEIPRVVVGSAVTAGAESLEVALFWSESITRHAIAFRSALWARDAWRRAGAGPLCAPAGNPMSDPRGSTALAAGLEGSTS